MDNELDEMWRNHICDKDEYEFDDITDKKEMIRAEMKGIQKREFEKVEVGQNINIKHVIRSKALDTQNFDLYDRVPLLSHEEAVEILKTLQKEDPTWAYDFSDTDGLIEYQDGVGKVTDSQISELEAPSKKPGTPIDSEDL